MQGRRNFRLGVQERPLRTGFCVLLALLILYNPFLALTTSYASYSVHGQARHRATVGACELQHLGCAQDQTQQDAVHLQELSEEIAGPAPGFEPVAFHQDVVLQPESVSRVWSRPPPTL
jgi:hypothetical protein